MGRTCYTYRVHRIVVDLCTFHPRSIDHLPVCNLAFCSHTDHQDTMADSRLESMARHLLRSSRSRIFAVCRSLSLLLTLTFAVCISLFLLLCNLTFAVCKFLFLQLCNLTFAACKSLSPQLCTPAFAACRSLSLQLSTPSPCAALLSP